MTTQATTAFGADPGAEVGAWLDTLPGDVRSAFADEVFDAATASSAVAAIVASEDAESFVEAVARNSDAISRSGRATRIRILAWFCAQPYRDASILGAITADEAGESGDEGFGGIGKVAPLFADDLRALAEALGPRAARIITDGFNVGIVDEAGMEAQKPTGPGGRP